MQNQVTHKLLLLGIVLVAVIAEGNDDYNAIAKQAIEGVDWDFEKEWAFTETRLEEGILWVGRYDPRRPRKERWQLMSVDGREPTTDEIEEYLDDQGEPDASDQRNIEAIVEPDSFRLIRETDEFWMFEFVPGEDNDEFLGHVDSTMKVIKDGNQLAYIDMRARKPFKPGFGVKMHDFVTSFRFGPASDDGPVVPLGIEARVRGRAFLVISFNEITQLSYSEFEYVGE